MGSKTVSAMAFILTAGLAGCSSMTVQPYSPVPEGLSIAKTQRGGYVAESVDLKRSGVTVSSEALEFCFSQNIPNINGRPVLNPSKTKVTAQGREQVSFVVPMTMGTPLNYDTRFSATLDAAGPDFNYHYDNIMIKGTWGNNENPLPASQDAAQYVESAMDAFTTITDDVQECIVSEM